MVGSTRLHVSLPFNQSPAFSRGVQLLVLSSSRRCCSLHMVARPSRPMRIQCGYGEGNDLNRRIEDAKNTIKWVFESALGGISNSFGKKQEMPKYTADIGSGGALGSGVFGGGNGGQHKFTSDYDDEEEPDWEDIFHTTMALTVLVSVYCLMLVRDQIRRYIRAKKKYFRQWRRFQMAKWQARSSAPRDTGVDIDFSEDYTQSILDDNELFEDGVED